ncbi:hypothetical protein [Chryseobacterium sp. CT-SW4]|uniref:hypothetical protein n=1 Tax=Chryseobacterium sp. SW-1 TaxID=3157343 RepID=UPI003B0165E5
MISIRRRKVFITSLVLFFCIYSCTKNEVGLQQSGSQKGLAKPVVTDTARINGYLFELIDNNGVAELKVSNDQIRIEGKIKMSAPCYFVRYENRLRNYEYPDIGIKAAVMILGDTLPSQNKPPCGRTLQGISLREDDKVVLSSTTINAENFCPDS